MIKKKLIVVGVFLFCLNFIFPQQANKKSLGLPRKDIIVNVEVTADIIERQNAYAKQKHEMIQLHKEAELAKQARESDVKKNVSFQKRSYIDIRKKNQKGIIDSDTSGSNFIFAQNEIANQRAEDLAQLKKEADLAEQARQIEFKKKEMELLVAKQKAEELKKQKEEEEEEKQLALQKKETIFQLCIIIFLAFFSVLSFMYFKNNFKLK